MWHAQEKEEIQPHFR